MRGNRIEEKKEMEEERKEKRKGERREKNTREKRGRREFLVGRSKNMEREGLE